MTKAIASLSELAHRQRSPEKVAELLSRARGRAAIYARLIPDWPALVADAARDADLVEERLKQLRAPAQGDAA